MYLNSRLFVFNLEENNILSSNLRYYVLKINISIISRLCGCQSSKMDRPCETVRSPAYSPDQSEKHVEIVGGGSS